MKTQTRTMEMIDIFIPSYKRADNLKSVKYLVRLGYDPEKIHVFLDSEATDYEDYLKASNGPYPFKLHVFDMDEARRRYDYVHRPSTSRRSVGQARNMFYDFAKDFEIDFFIVMDDDTTSYQFRPFGVYRRKANIKDLLHYYNGVRDMMVKQKIGCFGLSQTGDMFERTNTKLLRKKVMNTSFYYTKYIYRGEKGVQDEDTAQFVAMFNEGYFAGSLPSGLVLAQTASAQAKGGLTELYEECKLLNKSLVVPIMYPSCARAERQARNGGRLHHRITYRYLMPYLIKGERSNIAWDTYPEDVPFTNEPKRIKNQK